MAWTLRSVSLAAAVVVAPLFAAHAAGQYDGNWFVDAPSAQNAGTTERSSGCEPVRIPFTVSDNKISGNLQRSSYGTGRVESGTGKASMPITGTVAPDGSISAQWESYKATGKLSGNTAQIKWRGECGERVATGGRATSTTGSGSTPK
jgi:hypothetical protein